MHKAATFYALSFVAIATADAAVIYECKSYSGGTYLSRELCSKTNGVMTNMANVPDNMPFKEQTKMAEQIFDERARQEKKEDSKRSQTQECASIERELDQIWDRYKGGNYVPADQVSRDQTRQRALKNRRAALACTTDR